MPVMLRMKRWVALPEEWVTREDWKRTVRRNPETLRQTIADDLPGFLEACGGIEALIEKATWVDPLPVTRTCTKCRRELAISEFYLNNQGGRQRECGECVRNRNRGRR